MEEIIIQAAQAEHFTAIAQWNVISWT